MNGCHCSIVYFLISYISTNGQGQAQNSWNNKFVNYDKTARVPGSVSENHHTVE
jgi:hypothetical protein